MALTVAEVPTGIKAGVRISPRGVQINPVRALPLVAVSLKSNRCVIILVFALINWKCRYMETNDNLA